MNIRNFVKHISNFTDDVQSLEKLVLRYYIEFNSIKNVQNSKTLSSYCFVVEEEEYTEFKKSMNIYFEKNGVTIFTIDMLVNTFELLIPKEERKANGMVFTPEEIKIFIVNSIMNINNKEINQLKICDPACGSSSFLITISKYINNTYNVPYKYIIENMIYGVDIYSHNIEKSKLLLFLVALEDEEILEDEIQFNLIIGNSLDLNYPIVFQKVFNQNNGFDLVIGNPPYIRSKNISHEIKESLSNWSVTNVGNPDLYIAFFELGLNILNHDGLLGYISVNSYLSSLNGRNLRSYLSERRYQISIINFKDTQMFKGVTSYTCINIINKGAIADDITYVSLESLTEYNAQNLTHISFESLNNKQGWNIGDAATIENINKMRRFPKKLGDYGLKNGVATLSNDIYIVTATSIDDEYIHFIDKSGNQQKVEKVICRKMVKPNILRTQEDLVTKIEYLIFPYFMESNGKYKVIEENILIKYYPYTHRYLTVYKDKLLQRDKGKALDKYPAWYALGRTQGFNNTGIKLLLPYMTDKPVAIMSEDEDVLFYCGYALFSDSIQELKLLQRIIYSKVFWYYVVKTSKPYANGYMSFAKNYLKEFSIPELTNEQITLFLNEEDQNIIDEVLQEIYDVYLEENN